MKKNKIKQLEMFSPSEMNGDVERRDVIMDIYVDAYLKYMKKLSVLDDDTCRDILNECEAVKGKGIDGIYRMKKLGCSLNIYHYTVLRELAEMRLYASFSDVYSHHEEGIYHIHVIFPEAFVKARDTFRRLFSDKLNGKDKWITNLDINELL